MALKIRFFSFLLFYFFLFYMWNYNIFYDNVLCMKYPKNLLNTSYLNGKLFYYYGDIKTNEVGYRIKFLLDNFDKLDYRSVKYNRKGLIKPEFNPYSSFFHPHFLIDLKNNIDNFNNFYINFQMSGSDKLGFEQLTSNNFIEDEPQYISPNIRVYETNLVEFRFVEYEESQKFIKDNEKIINNYIFKNLKDYVPNFEISKK